MIASYFFRVRSGICFGSVGRERDFWVHLLLRRRWLFGRLAPCSTDMMRHSSSSVDGHTAPEGESSCSLGSTDESSMPSCSLRLVEDAGSCFTSKCSSADADAETGAGAESSLTRWEASGAESSVCSSCGVSCGESAQASLKSASHERSRMPMSNAGRVDTSESCSLIDKCARESALSSEWTLSTRSWASDWNQGLGAYSSGSNLESKKALR